VPGYVRFCGKSIRYCRVVKNNGLPSTRDGAKNRFGMRRFAVDALAQTHSDILSRDQRFGLYAQFVASRNN
jgi:hypothetical protein